MNQQNEKKKLLRKLMRKLDKIEIRKKISKLKVSMLKEWK